MPWVCIELLKLASCCALEGRFEWGDEWLLTIFRSSGKVGMSVLVKGLAMDFVRQERNEMAITGIWPAAVCSNYFQPGQIPPCVYMILSNLVQSIESAATEYNKSSDKSYKKDLRKPVRKHTHQEPYSPLTYPTENLLRRNPSHAPRPGYPGQWPPRY
jgi:hypothetical protein